VPGAPKSERLCYCETELDVMKDYFSRFHINLNEPNMMLFALLCTNFAYFDAAQKTAIVIALMIMYRKKSQQR